MATWNFLVDFWIKEQNTSEQESETIDTIKQAPYLTDVENVSWATAEPTIPEYEKWGLNNEEEFDLMEQVKAQWGSADDFTFILNDFRTKSNTVSKVEDEFTPEENISWLDIWVKAGKGISWFAEEIKLEWTDLPSSWLDILKTAWTAVANVPWDAVQVVWETIEMVSDPIGVLKSFKDLWLWLMEKASKLWLSLWTGITETLWGEVSDISKENIAQERPHESTVDAVWEMLVEKYGTLDKATKTITENPVDTILLLKSVINTASKAKWLPEAEKVKLEAIDKSLSEKLSDSAIKDIEQWLWATKEKFKQKSRELAPDIIKKEIRGSKEWVQQLAEQQKTKFWSKIKDFIDSWKLEGTVNRDDLLDTLDNIRKEGQVWDIIIDEAIVSATDKMADAISWFGREIPASKARELRQMFDDAVYNTKGVISEEALSLKNNIKKSLADNIRKQLAEQNPDLAALNKEFSFYSKLDEVLTETLNRQGSQQGGLSSNIMGGGWLAAGWAVFWDITGAIATAAVVKWLSEAMRSTRWKLISASTKNKLAKALASWDKTAATKIASEIISKVLENKTKLFIGWQVTESNIELNK